MADQVESIQSNKGKPGVARRTGGSCILREGGIMRPKLSIGGAETVHAMAP